MCTHVLDALESQILATKYRLKKLEWSSKTIGFTDKSTVPYNERSDTILTYKYIAWIKPMYSCI